MDNMFAYKTLLIAAIVVLSTLFIKKIMRIEEHYPTAPLHDEARDSSPSEERFSQKIPAIAATPLPLTVQPVDPPAPKKKEVPGITEEPSRETRRDTERLPAVKPRFSREWKGLFCGLKKPVRQVVRNREIWETLWDRFSSNYPTKVFTPKVDFGSKMVIVLALGDQPADKSSIVTIGKISMQDNKLVITVKKSVSSAQLEPSISTVQPYHLKVVPRNPAPEQFVEQ